MKHFSQLFISVLLVFTLSSASLVYATGTFFKHDHPVIKNGIEYFERVQQQDGSIGSYNDTAWCTIAIAASGIEPGSFGNPSLVEYLQTSQPILEESFNLPADLALSILAIVAGGEDPHNFGTGNSAVPEGDYISALLNTHDGTQFGVSDSINEDVWAVIALLHSGYPVDDPVIVSTVDFILGNQGEDGGWSWATPFNDWYSDSTPDDTAGAIMALSAAGHNTKDQFIKNALKFLESTQSEQGGFSYLGVTNTSSTAWAVSALVTLGLNPDEWNAVNGNPVDYLVSMQSPDGSFRFADPLPQGYMAMPEKMTADAIIALMGNNYMVSPPVSTNTVILWVALGALIVVMIGFLWHFNRK